MNLGFINFAWPYLINRNNEHIVCGYICTVMTPGVQSLDWFHVSKRFVGFSALFFIKTEHRVMFTCTYVLYGWSFTKEGFKIKFLVYFCFNRYLLNDRSYNNIQIINIQLSGVLKLEDTFSKNKIILQVVQHF